MDEDRPAVGTRLEELLLQKGIENAEIAPYEARIKYLVQEIRISEQEKQFLEEELSRHRELVQTLFERAVRELKKENYIDAMGILQAFLLHEPENTKAMINLAVAYSELGYHDRAKMSLHDVITREPDNEIAKRNLAILNENI
jgi:Tfp pilus assembly protein PilF